MKLLKIDENNVNKILDVSDTKASLEKAISEKDVLVETLEVKTFDDLLLSKYFI